MIFAWFLRRRRSITRLISTDLGGKEAAYKPLVSDKEINGYLRLLVGLTWACMEMVMKSFSLCLFVCCSGIHAEAGGWPFVFDKELRTKREGKEKKRNILHVYDFKKTHSTFSYYGNLFPFSSKEWWKGTRERLHGSRCVCVFTHCTHVAIPGIGSGFADGASI